MRAARCGRKEMERLCLRKRSRADRYHCDRLRLRRWTKSGDRPKAWCHGLHLLPSWRLTDSLPDCSTRPARVFIHREYATLPISLIGGAGSFGRSQRYHRSGHRIAPNSRGGNTLQRWQNRWIGGVAIRCAIGQQWCAWSATAASWRGGLFTMPGAHDRRWRPSVSGLPAARC